MINGIYNWFSSFKIFNFAVLNGNLNFVFGDLIKGNIFTKFSCILKKDCVYIRDFYCDLFWYNKIYFVNYFIILLTVNGGLLEYIVGIIKIFRLIFYITWYIFLLLYGIFWNYYIIKLLFYMFKYILKYIFFVIEYIFARIYELCEGVNIIKYIIVFSYKVFFKTFYNLYYFIFYFLPLSVNIFYWIGILKQLSLYLIIFCSKLFKNIIKNIEREIQETDFDRGHVPYYTRIKYNVKSNFINKFKYGQELLFIFINHLKHNIKFNIITKKIFLFSLYLLNFKDYQKMKWNSYFMVIYIDYLDYVSLTHYFLIKIGYKDVNIKNPVFFCYFYILQIYFILFIYNIISTVIVTFFRILIFLNYLYCYFSSLLLIYDLFKFKINRIKWFLHRQYLYKKKLIILLIKYFWRI
jgi:hypothetical protein